MTCASSGTRLHETFSQLARNRPNAIALICGSSRISYGELERRANEYAALLCVRNLGEGDLVVIRSDRSIQMIVALLSVLKAGAFFAVVDPKWPEQRTSRILDMLKPRVFIDLAQGRAPEFLTEPAIKKAAPATNSQSSLAYGEHPCCVFFTSGTTGEPKLVLTSHRALARLFQSPTFATFGPDTVIPLAAPPAWDAFALELWGALLNGGVSLLVDEPYLTPVALRSGIADHGLNTVWLTSSLFNMFVEEDCDAFAGLRQVIIGGERLSVRHVRAFLQQHADIALINGYGPVESAVFATTHRITIDDCNREHGIPLGIPVPETRIFILDGTRLCTDGERGEICIAGGGLAIGYFGDPDLTAEKFPIVSLRQNDTQVYRTGDYGCICKDGLLHYAGRGDRQVKIRGHRIEPAEVENQIEALLDTVQSCRVIPRVDDDGIPQELIAFCIPTTPSDKLESALEILRVHLPQYQIPAKIISVDRFPLTPQGKIDSVQLMSVANGHGTAQSETSRISKDDDVGRIASVMADVIGRRSILPSTPFFALGATSLDVGRVCSRLGSLFGHPVPLAWLYQAQSAEALAQRISRFREQLNRREVSRASEKTQLTSMQILFLLRHLRNPFDVSSHCVLVWQLKGDMKVSALERAVNRVHKRHEALRACYLLDRDPKAVVNTDTAVPLIMLQSQPDFQSAITALKNELASPLDPTTGTVWRTAVAPLRLGDTALFGCVVHHIAFDGWSESLLANEISAHYDFSQSEAVLEPLPPSLAVSNAEAAVAEIEDDAKPSLRAFVQELVDAPVVEWPVPAQSTSGIDCFEANVDATTMAKVLTRVSSSNVSRLSMLLWCLSHCLTDVFGQDDFVVGVPVRARGRILDFAIGCHINMVCVRMRPDPLQKVGHLEHTEAVVQRALAMSHRPFTEILEAANALAKRHSLLYKIVFALQDFPSPELRLKGLETSFHRQPYLDLPVDLHVEAWPTATGGLRIAMFSRREVLPPSAGELLLFAFVSALNSLAEATR